MIKLETLLNSKRLGPIALLALTQACSFHKSAPEPKPSPEMMSAQPVAPAIIEPSTKNWLKSSVESENKQVKLEVEEMTDDERERFRQQFQKTSLKALAVDPKYNVNAFKIEGVDLWKNAVFLAPRLYSYGSVENGRVLPIRNADDTLSISFPLVLIDGRQTQILSADGYTSIRISSAFMVTNETELQSELEKTNGEKQTLGALPGCPRRIFMRVGEKEYDLTPPQFAKADYCPLNQPFNVTLRASEKEVRFILERAVDVSAVEIFTEYETQAHFAFRKSKMEINADAFASELKDQIKSRSKNIKKAEMTELTLQVLKRFAAQVNLKEEYLARLDSKAKDLAHLYFETVKVEPGKEKEFEDCLDPLNPCVAIPDSATEEKPGDVSKPTQKPTGPVVIEWSDTIASKSGQIYLTWTRLKPIIERTADIGVAPGRMPLRNKLGDLGNIFETGLTVAEGDLLEIKPAYVIRERREIAQPVQKQIDNNVCIRKQKVCVKKEPVFEHKCTEDCSWTMKCSAFPPACYPWKECEEKCHDEQVGEKCVQEVEDCMEYQNQWVKRTDYSEPAGSAYDRIDQPIAQLPTLFDGIKLGFTYVDSEGNRKNTRCALSQFRRDGDGGRILVRLENVKSCDPIFSENSRVRPLLQIINDIDETLVYRFGYDLLYWDNHFEAVPPGPGFIGGIRGRFYTYKPSYDLAATVAIKGYDFMSSFSGGMKDPKLP